MSRRVLLIGLLSAPVLAITLLAINVLIVMGVQ